MERRKRSADREPGGAHRQAHVPEDTARDTVEDAAVRLSDYRIEDYVAFLAVAALAGGVFLQVFTRYVLNDSIAWTEEIARYLLISVTFVGGGLAIRRNSQISVGYFYRFLPHRSARVLSTFIDLGNIAFWGIAGWLTYRLMVLTPQRMVSIGLPMSVLYGVVLFGFAFMVFRAVQVAWRHWRQGYSDLTENAIQVTKT